MQQWKVPPIAKVYEALSAVIDGRVANLTEHSAMVTSSSGDKRYTIEWAENFDWITSNDNASYWKGYAGYPIIAVLLTKGILEYDPAKALLLKGVHWKQLNTKHKNKYDKAIEEVLSAIRDRGSDATEVTSECQRIIEKFEMLKLKRPPKRRPPPTATMQERQQALL